MAKRNGVSKPKKVSEEAFVAALPWALEQFLVIDGIEPGKQYERTHDDHDGEWEGTIRVEIADDGDVWVGSDRFPGMLRFRNSFGGGCSPRVWNALRILALAINLDEAASPEDRS